MVNTDTQDLGIYPVEPVESDLVRRDLGSSDGSPGQREESQNHISPAEVIAQAHLLFGVILETEPRGSFANCECHLMALLSARPILPASS